MLEDQVLPLASRHEPFLSWDKHNIARRQFCQVSQRSVTLRQFTTLHDLTQPKDLFLHPAIKTPRKGLGQVQSRVGGRIHVAPLVV